MQWKLVEKIYIYQEEQYGGRHVTSEMCARLDFVQEGNFSLTLPPTNQTFVSCPVLKSCLSFSLFLFPLVDRHRSIIRCSIRRNRWVKLGIMAEGLTLRGTLKGHNGWVTQIATNPQHPDKILSGSRGTYFGNWICVVAGV